MLKSWGWELNPYRAALQAHGLNFEATKQGFIKYVKFKRYNPRWARSMVNYLTRYVKEIQNPTDVMNIFSPLSDGQRHNLNRAMRSWFNYLQTAGIASKEHFDQLRRGIPKDKVFIDLHIPAESAIINDLKILGNAPLKFQAVYNLCLDSGLRLVEAMTLIHNYKEPERVNGFCRQNIGMFRGEKQAYYGYYSEYTHDIILKTEKPFSQQSVEKYAQNHDITRAKYLRKFAFDQMLALGIPESTADFIEGRVARKVGVRHYANLRRQADQWYKKYAEYIVGLRKK